MDERDRPLLDPVAIGDERVRGHALQRCGAGGLEVDVVRNGEEPLGVGEDEPRVEAVDHGPGDPVTDGHGRALADLTHRAGGLEALHVGRVGGVDAGALVGVDEVHPTGGDLHEGLAGSGRGDLALLEGEDLGSSVTGDDERGGGSHGPHHRDYSEAMTSSSMASVSFPVLVFCWLTW